MNINQRSQTWGWWCLGAMFILGFIFQWNMAANWDVNWLMMVTQKLLNGKHYYTSFFETNPPMILYLYTPAVVASKLLHVGYRVSFLVYMFILAAVVTYLSKTVLNAIIEEKFANLILAMLVALVFVLTILPIYSFGQRDPIAMMLTLPYLLLVAGRAKGIRFRFGLLLTVGVLAGIGFALKPYFLVMLALVELYLMAQQRRFLSWVRTEFIIVAMICILYLASIFIFEPNYIYKILPMVSNIYFPALPWFLLFEPHRLIIFFIVAGFYIFLRNNIEERYIGDILMLGATGFLFSYVWQRTHWYYHYIPMLGLSTLLLVLLLFARHRPRRPSIKVALVATLIACPLLLTIVYGIDGYLKNVQAHSSPLARFLQKNADNKKVFVFSTIIPDTYMYTGIARFEPASRLPSFLVLGGLIKQQRLATTDTQRKRLEGLRQEIFEIVWQDLAQHPQWLLVDVSPVQTYIDVKHFDYLKYFSTDPRIKRLLASYHFVTKVDKFDIYTLLKAR